MLTEQLTAMFEYARAVDGFDPYPEPIDDANDDDATALKASASASHHATSSGEAARAERELQIRRAREEQARQGALPIVDKRIGACFLAAAAVSAVLRCC